MQMGKFWQISTEIRPLIDVRNWFSLSIFGIPLPIFFKLGKRVDIVKACSGDGGCCMPAVLLFYYKYKINILGLSQKLRVINSNVHRSEPNFKSLLCNWCF